MPRGLIKSFNSDTVSIIANFAKLRHAEQNLLLGKTEKDTDEGEGLGLADEHSEVMGRLYHFIRHEKPYFLEKIDPRDLFRIFVVEPQQSFERIRAQSGAFLISVSHERFERNEILELNPGIPVYDHYTLTVLGESRKDDIMKDLRLLNITHESLFPWARRSGQGSHATLFYKMKPFVGVGADRKKYRDQRRPVNHLLFGEALVRPLPEGSPVVLGQPPFPRLPPLPPLW